MNDFVHPSELPLPSDAELVEHYYGESERPDEIDRLLTASPELASRYAELAALLDAVEPPAVPERPSDWEADLWSRIEPRLASASPRRGSVLSGPWARAAVIAAVAAALLVGAFVLGRQHGRQEEHLQATSQGFSQESRDRLLLAAAIDHLDRSEVFLVSFKNEAPATAGSATFEEARTRAAELVVSNRLLRRSLDDDRRAEATAVPASRAGLAAVLEDLEPLLLEIAHAPDALPAQDLDLLRTRLRDRGTLVKLRAVQGRLQRENTTSAKASRPGARA